MNVLNKLKAEPNVGVGEYNIASSVIVEVNLILAYISVVTPISRVALPIIAFPEPVPNRTGFAKPVDEGALDAQIPKCAPEVCAVLSPCRH